jgi:pilus assembly protein TadC
MWRYIGLTNLSARADLAVALIAFGFLAIGLWISTAYGHQIENKTLVNVILIITGLGVIVGPTFLARAWMTARRNKRKKFH